MRRTKKKSVQMVLPSHWTGEQALAVAECLQMLRETLLKVYGAQIQRAWQDQLVPTWEVAAVDPDEPF
jgi:hypothetical protein